MFDKRVKQDSITYLTRSSRKTTLLQHPINTRQTATDVPMLAGERD